MEDVTEVIVEPEPVDDEPILDAPEGSGGTERTGSSPDEAGDDAVGSTNASPDRGRCENPCGTEETLLRGSRSPPEAPSLDAHRSRRSVAFFAVFDGHGGREAAQFARDYLWECIKKQRGFWSDCDREVCSAIRKGFVACHHAMWKKLREFINTYFN